MWKCASGAEHCRTGLYFLEARPKLCEEMYKMIIITDGTFVLVYNLLSSSLSSSSSVVFKCSLEVGDGKK